VRLILKKCTSGAQVFKNFCCCPRFLTVPSEQVSKSCRKTTSSTLQSKISTTSRRLIHSQEKYCVSHKYSVYNINLSHTVETSVLGCLVPVLDVQRNITNIGYIMIHPSITAVLPNLAILSI